MQIGDRVVERQALLRRVLRTRIRLPGRQRADVAEHAVRVGEARERERVVRIGGERALVVHDALPHRWRVPAVPQEAALEIRHVGLGIDRAAAAQPLSLLGRELDPHLGRDRARDFVLEREDVGQRTLVALRPQARVGLRVHQLDRDPDAIAGAQRRALDHRVDRQLARDLGQRPAGSLEAHRRGARDHAQRADLGQACDQRVGHPVGEELLLGIAGAVRERQHHQRADPAVAGRGRLPGDRLAGGQRRQRIAAQRARERVGVGEAPGRVLLQAAGDDVVEIGRESRAHRARARRLLVGDRVQQHRGLVAGERAAPGAHLEQDRPERVQIGARVDPRALHLLGRQVRDGSGDAERHARGRRERRIERVDQHVREPEVQDLGPAARSDHDVAGLEIAMDDPLLVRGLERLGDPGRDRARAALGQRPRAQELRERLPRHQLEHQEVDAVLAVEIEQGRDVGMEEPRQRARLEPEPPAQPLVAQRVVADHLEGDLALEAGIDGAVHLAHPTFPEAFDDLIAAQ